MPAKAGISTQTKEAPASAGVTVRAGVMGLGDFP